MERAGEEGEHQWHFLDLDSAKQLFLFNSFGFTGLKDFIIQDDHKIINKILGEAKLIFWSTGKTAKKNWVSMSAK